MNPLDVAHTYFDDYNQRDPAAIVATFAEGGTYSDPTVPALMGPALAAYTSGLFAAFPNLSFEIASAACKETVSLPRVQARQAQRAKFEVKSLTSLWATVWF
jgi:hypothetical protein